MREDEEETEDFPEDDWEGDDWSDENDQSIDPF